MNETKATAIGLDILLLNDLLNEGIIDRRLYNLALQKMQTSKDLVSERS